jgi:hypothetical protein
MTPRPVTRLQFESLEGRTLMTATPVTPPITPAPLVSSVVLPNSLRHALAGQTHGIYAVGLPVTDIGGVYSVTGSGNLGRLGQVTISGTVSGVGNIIRGRARGTLTISNANGSVTLDLLGPDQKSFAALPQMFQYRIISATGQYVALRDRGMIRLDLQPTPGLPSSGGFTLSI